MKPESTALLIALFAVLPLQAADKLPGEVRKFIEKRDSCEDFRGEVADPKERERMREASRQIERLCRGN